MLYRFYFSKWHTIKQVFGFVADQGKKKEEKKAYHQATTTTTTTTSAWWRIFERKTILCWNVWWLKIGMSERGSIKIGKKKKRWWEEHKKECEFEKYIFLTYQNKLGIILSLNRMI